MSPVRAAKEMADEVGSLRPWTLFLVLSLSATLGGGVGSLPTAVQSGNWVPIAIFQDYKEKMAERTAARDTDFALMRQQLEMMNSQLKALIDSQVRYQDKMQAEVANLISTVDGRLPKRSQ